MTNDIKLFKLVNGDIVLTKFERTEGGDYLFLKPVSVIPVGPQQVGMQPWLGGQDMDEPVEIMREHVIAGTKVDKELLDGYNEKFHGVPAIQLATQADAALLKNAEKGIIA